jgi:hypothetical protein
MECNRYEQGDLGWTAATGTALQRQQRQAAHVSAHALQLGVKALVAAHL